jgi:hypothetical protein
MEETTDAETANVADTANEADTASYSDIVRQQPNANNENG